MKKVAVALSVLGALTFAQAESNGAFVGLGAGFGENKLTVNYEGDSWSGKKSTVNYIFIAGYKAFMNDNFGYRTYVSYDQSNRRSIDRDGTDSISLKTQSVALNVEALYNFVNQNDTSYGVFGGFGLGAVKSKISEVDAADKYSLSKTKFEPTLNFGVRALFAKNHGIELNTKVALKKSKFNVTEDGETINVKVTRNPRVDFIYTYNF